MWRCCQPVILQTHLGSHNFKTENQLYFHRTPVKKIWVPVEATSDVLSKWRVARRPIFYRQLKVLQLVNDVKTIYFVDYTWSSVVFWCLIRNKVISCCIKRFYLDVDLDLCACRRKKVHRDQPSLVLWAEFN